MQMFTSYEEFKKAYAEAFRLMMSYSCDQVGSGHYAEKMAAMSDAYPDWADLAEMEA
jgi:hypothetical protein